jgi:putative nucleotidyltransferase with HDIG domain
MGILNKYHVASGSFEAGKKQSRLLQAFLGTCVGVAIIDETAGVGGLTHLLLPEPVNPSNVDHPEKYAASGMPLFVEELSRLGAKPANMRAMIAGGALVGPLTQLDMNLDIGGRTAENVLDFLNDRNIEVVHSETGGFFTCSLELDMQTLAGRILPAGFEAANNHPGDPDALDVDIQAAIEAVRPIPQVALKVLRIIQEGSYDIEKVAGEVRKDQVISAKTIQMCNSAMFSKGQDVASLDHALVFLGQDLFLKLVISAAVESYYSQSGSGYSLCKGGLYHHAVGTAMTAERIARMTGKAIAPIAYTAGLLHDIGKVVLDQHIAGAYPLFYREFQDRPAELINLEQRFLARDHTEIGATLAQSWSLPDILTDVIRFHHQPEKSTCDRMLTTTVYLADLLMSRFHTGLELECMGTDKLIDHLALLDLSVEQFGMLVDAIPRKVFQAAEPHNGDTI